MRIAFSWLLTAAVLVSTGVSSEIDLPMELGESLDHLTLSGLLGSEDYDRLGLEQDSGELCLGDVEGDLLVLEFFNRFCVTCWHQAEQLEAFYESVSNEDLGGRIQVLAVGSGNRRDGLELFREQTKISYPLALDPFFEAFRAIGDPGGTPFTLFLLNRAGSWTIADYHLGFRKSSEMAARSRIMLEGGTPAESEVPRKRSYTRDLAPDLDPAAQGQIVDRFAERFCEPGTEVDTVAAPGCELLYRLGGSPPVYVRFVRKRPVCDLCHTILFAIAMDDEGVVRGFEPLYVTKYGNLRWVEADTEPFTKRFVGRRGKHLGFQPEADAVTTATMSSMLIYDGARETARLIAALEDE